MISYYNYFDSGSVNWPGRDLGYSNIGLRNSINNTKFITINYCIHAIILILVTTYITL